MATLNVICRKRLMGDLKLIRKDPHKYIDVSPDEKDLLTWYFLVKGPEFSEYKGGYYIGKVMHNESYPFKSPDFMMLTPSGRFTVGTKICLSNSSYHSDEWSAMWNIHAILTGFLSIFLDDKEHGISHIHSTKYERESYAKTSIEYNKKNHPNLIKLFTRFLDSDGNEIPENLQNQTDDKKEEVKKEEVKKEEIKKEDKKEECQKEEEIKKEEIKKDEETKKEIINEDPKKEQSNKKKDFPIKNKKKINNNKNILIDDLKNDRSKYNATMEQYNQLINEIKKK